MVEIFRELAGSQSAPMIALAGGIWKALLTTVAGLSVAVPVILFHTFLSSRVDNQEETLNRGSDFLLREHILRHDSFSGFPTSEGESPIP
jgi:biopolymer transport protein ExbB